MTEELLSFSLWKKDHGDWRGRLNVADCDRCKEILSVAWPFANISCCYRSMAAPRTKPQVARACRNSCFWKARASNTTYEYSHSQKNPPPGGRAVVSFSEVRLIDKKLLPWREMFCLSIFFFTPICGLKTIFFSFFPYTVTNCICSLLCSSRPVVLHVYKTKKGLGHNQIYMKLQEKSEKSCFNQ